MMPGQGAYYQQSPHPPLHHPQQYHPQQPPPPHTPHHHPPPHPAHSHHPHPHSHHPHHPGAAAMQTPQRPPPSSRQPGPTPGGHYMQMGGTPSNPGPSASKRARTASSAAAASAAGPSNPIIGSQDAPEDEEDTSRGDLFDHIPARDISTHRYKQHHEWFEEVFTSPYGSSDIKPGSIGLEQLGDWIKPLIDGLIDKEGNPSTGKSYNEALREIGERARAETAKVQSQIDEMEREHRRHLDEFRTSRTLLDADRELREAMIKEELAPLGFTLPDADYETFHNPRPATEIIADLENKFNIKVIEVLERDGAHCWNIQPEVIAYEEAQAREAAAAAAAAKAAREAKAAQAAQQAAAAAAASASNTPGGGGTTGGGDGGAGSGSGSGSHELANKDQDSAMAGVAASESTSPDNARYLVPVVIEKTDTNTGSSSVHPPPDAPAVATTITTSTAPPAAVANATAAPTTATTAADHDTVMSDAEPLQAITATAPTTAAPPAAVPTVVAPLAAPLSAGTPASNPLSPFGIPSPSTAAGFTPGGQSGTATPSLSTPLPTLADPTKPQTPSALAAAITPGSKPEEPPTVPGEDEVPDGFAGGDDELDLDDFGGGGAAEALDLLGADSSFADEFE